MRLQVSVKRYSLPTTNIIFTTNTLGPSPATSSTDATIAQLLEDVNDIVPLESADWGLEDYAVEVNGYECLHFSPIDAVLRENDQVVIRALKTQDLRSRRLGGRHQIGSDGKHLIDGVAFGRQWLKKGGRPAVQIPPRKRLKIEGAEEREEEEEEEEARPLALTGLEHAYELVDEESDEEEEDSDFVDEDADALGGESDDRTRPSFMIDTEPDLQILARQEFLDADVEAQDRSEEGESDEHFTDDDLSAEEVEVELSAELQALHEEEHQHNSKVNGRRHTTVSQISPNSESDMRTVRRKRKRTVGHNIQDDDGEDFNGFSSPLTKRSKADEDFAAHDSNLKSTSSSSSDTDEDSKSGAFISPSQKQQGLYDNAGSDSSSDNSEETSSSDSDSSNEAVSDDETSGSFSSSSQISDVADSNRETYSRIELQKRSIASPPKISLPSVTPVTTRRPAVPPGQGLRRTHYTNQRQKKRHRLVALKEQGLLPENATFADMAAYDEDQKTSNLGPAAAVAKVIEAKKRELLEQVGEHMKEQLTEQTAEQNPYVSWDTAEEKVHSVESTTQHPEASFTDDPSRSLRGPDTPLDEGPVQNLISALPAPAWETKSEPPKRRARLDLNSTRNMIFNGLGVRKPKTEAAEQALREKLAEPVKGALPKQLFKDPVTKQDESSTRSADSQMPWQSRLVLSAVECELEGIILREPPFPFFQGWDEDANRRLRNKKKNRNQRQYYAYDDATAIDGYELEYEETQDQDDSILYCELNGRDKLDHLTTQASSLIDEARDQLSEKASNLPAKESEDLPRPNNVGSLDELQQQAALPGAVIAYKEFHLNETSFQPEISEYRVALVEAVREDGSLDLRISKRDRRPPKVAKYDEETGERILSRSEMWEAGDDAVEDDGSRQLSYADLIEPKIVQVPTTSKSAASISLRGGEVPKRTAASVPEPAVPLELTVSDAFALRSGQPPSQTITKADTKIDITTPRQMETSAMTKEAGFNSILDSEVLRSLDGETDTAQHVSTKLNFPEGSQNQSRKTSADPASEAQQTALDTSGFESPRFNGWSSSPAIEPEPGEATEVTCPGELRDSSQNESIELEEESVGNGSSMPKNDVTHPHISQLELDAPIEKSSGDNLRSEGGDGVPIDGESSKDLEDALPLDNSATDVVEETHLDSLGSIIPQPMDESQEEGQPRVRNGHATAAFLDGLDGQTSSDDHGLPSLARITATARSQSSREWPPPRIRLGNAKATPQRRSTSLLVEATASGSQPPMKQPQSQVSLSQIPLGAQVVDLTLSSDPVSSGNGNGDYTKRKRLPFNSNKAKVSSIRTRASENDALTAGTGLGNRRLLKLKKAKP